MKSTQFSFPLTLVTLFTLIFAVSGAALGAKSGGKSRGPGGDRTRIALLTGYASQGFTVPQADFSHFDTYYYGLRVCHSWGFWNHGLEYAVASGASVKKFTLSDNTVGNYQLDFNRINLLLGFDVGAFAMHLIVGTEAANWSGSPQLGAETTNTVQYGVDMSYDFSLRPAVVIPLMITVLSHPERKFTFKNYPADSLTAQASLEYQIGTGLAFEF